MVRRAGHARRLILRSASAQGGRSGDEGASRHTPGGGRDRRAGPTGFLAVGPLLSSASATPFSVCGSRADHVALNSPIHPVKSYLPPRSGEARMRRREFAKLVAATVSWPRVASAQKPMPVIGFLHSASPAAAAANVAAFHQSLREHGYVIGQNVAIEYRWAEGNYDRMPVMAGDLVTHKVNVIVAGGGSPSALAAKGATSTIPIVFANVGNPVEQGLVASSPGRAA